MNTLLFKYAIEVGRTHSISQAANNLYMAQPNLSKAIKELEEALGISIFKRTSKGVFPTQKGSEFLVYAKNIMSQIDKMERLYALNNPDRQFFSISTPHGSYIADGFVDFIAEFDFNKEIDVYIEETTSMQTIESILNNQSHFGIIRYQTANEAYFDEYLKERQLFSELIWEFELLALMSKKHPLAETENVKYEELKEYIELYQGDTAVPYTQKNRRNEEIGYSPKSIFVHERCCLLSILERIPTTYSLASPVPGAFLTKHGLTQRKSDYPNRKCKDLLVFQKGYKFSNLDKKFLDKLFASKNDVAFNEHF